MKAVLMTSSILILLIAALRPILRGKIPPKVQYALWLVAALRLLIPVNLVTSAYSALALLDRGSEPPPIIETIGQTTVPVQSYDSARAQVIERYHQQGVSDSALTPSDLMAIDTQARELMRGPTLAELAAKLARPVWLGGAALMALWFAFVNLRLRRKLKDAEFLDVDCPLPVYLSGALPSPCLSGVFRPAIYVTPAALESPGRLRHVLAHELTHYRHRDHWWALLRCACLCVYWFDPLVWWAAALSRQDCELACDEGAIRRLGEGERIPYGRTLVGMIAAGRNPLLQTATTMTGGKKRVKERVALIARKPKTVIAVALALAVIVGCAVGCTFTGAPETPEEPQQPLTADTLRERLADIPEELREDVATGPSTQSLYSSALAAYWMERPWTDYSEGFGWLLTVYRWNQEEFDANYVGDDTWTWDCFAKGNGAYYVIQRPSDVRWPASEEMLAEFEGATQADIDNNAYMVAFEAIREFAKQTVLATEGVEPYSPEEERQPLDTLQERLLDVPEELRDNVEARPDEGTLAVYYFKHPGEPVDESQYLLLVLERTEEEFENYRTSIHYNSGGTQWFAKRGSTYYVFNWNTSIEYDMEDEEQFNAASRAVQNFAKSTVLATEGVEPYTPDEERQPLDTLQARLMDIPAELQDRVSFSLINEEPSHLADYWFDIPDEWTDMELWGGYMLSVGQCDTADLESAANMAYHVFARTGNQYYATFWCNDGRFEGYDEYWDAVGAIRAYAEQQVLATEGVEPYTYDPGDTQLTASPAPEQIIQSVVDRLMTAPTVTLGLAPAGTSRVYVYPTVPSEDYFADYLSDLPTYFHWEEAPYSTSVESDYLRIESGDGSASLFLSEGSFLVLATLDGETTCYRGQYIYDTNTPVTPFANLRRWFDEVELSHLRTTSVPARGQSHQEIVEEWLEGYEGVMTKVAPGSGYACTYVQPIDVHADFHSGLSTAEMEDFTLNWGGSLSADEYGKTWFTFTYRLIFVPVNQSTTSPFWAGNTWYYEEEGAPEGALTYSRVGYLWLTDEGWTCTGTGTGW